MTHLYHQIKSIAETKYKDIVTGTKTLGKRTVGSSKLRLFIKDGSFLDIWLSGTGKYSFHWEERAQRGLIHRYDNAPDYPGIETHPKHFFRYRQSALYKRGVILAFAFRADDGPCLPFPV